MRTSLFLAAAATIKAVGPEIQSALPQNSREGESNMDTLRVLPLAFVCGLLSTPALAATAQDDVSGDQASATCAVPLSVIDVGAAATTFNISGISSSLNNHNHVAGYVPASNPKAEAAVYADGRVKLLGTLGGSFSYALGVNNSGKIVGYSYLSGDTTLHAARFSTVRAPQDLGTLGGSTSTAHAVNNRGTIVGAASLPWDKETHVARFTDRGVVDPGTLGGSNSSADALNNVGQAVGTAELTGDNASHAVLYPSDGGATVDLGTLGGNSGSAANGVNDAGFAVGYSSVPLGGVLHATLFMSWAAPIDLGGAQSEARGIDQAADIVG
jgi:probable HAF family extracellular repeat protein